MTREEFKENPPLYKKVMFEEKVYECIEVNTQELCGLDIHTNHTFWVRCENITLINEVVINGSMFNPDEKKALTEQKKHL